MPIPSSRLSRLIALLFMVLAMTVAHAVSAAATEIAFPENSSTLTEGADSTVSAWAKIAVATSRRYEIVAYAGDDASSEDRRLALKRVLAVNERLLALGFQPDQFDLRALPEAAPAGSENQVAILPLSTYTLKTTSSGETGEQ